MVQLLGCFVGSQEPFHPLGLVVVHVQVGFAHVGFAKGHCLLALLLEAQGLELLQTVALGIGLAALQDTVESVGKAHFGCWHTDRMQQSEGYLNQSVGY